MKIASIAEIRKELKFLSEKELQDLVLELATFNMDNKRKLYFTLFGRHNPQLFTDMVKEELEDEFQKGNARNYYYAKKSAQKIRRVLNKYLKFTKDKAIQAELIVFFCQKLEEYGYLFNASPVMENLYAMQIGKIEKAVAGLHEDLRYDFEEPIAELKKHLR
ncbi:hypothetical protein [Pararhodonellum marinum]|uniref:hypothetical protein n=1 Tax=Pararhodonellum marinum TaxID=2755358 RepID=UPI00188F984B|nr:hypothetical protein [Pararhodonellum marinum]